MTRFLTGFFKVFVILITLLGCTRKNNEVAVLDDISLRYDNEVITFSNSKVKLTFSETNGKWLSLHGLNLKGNLINPDESIPEVNFKLNNHWAGTGWKQEYKGYSYDISPQEDEIQLNFHYAVMPSHVDRKDESITLTKKFSLFPNKGRVERSASIINNHADRLHTFEDFLFNLPGFAIGQTDECVIDAPGPWFPNSYVKPGTPYNDFKHKTPLHAHSAPDAGFGVITISNPKANVAMVTWMDTNGEVNYSPQIQFSNSQLHLMFNNHRADFMKAGQKIDSDVQRIELIEGDVDDALQLYKKFCSKTYVPDAPTPDWVKTMVLLEVYPKYYSRGFREITERLPFYKNIGFNALYLMPHWQGGYSPLDFYTVNPDYGTKADLKGLVDKAHQLGMKVFFDMVIHGFNERSPIVKSNPELFVHDSLGNISRHRTWKSMSANWASPDYLEYMGELALYDIKEFNIDGYRLDAASYKGPGWDKNAGHPAYKSGTNAVGVMQRMLQSLRSVN